MKVDGRDFASLAQEAVEASCVRLSEHITNLLLLEDFVGNRCKFTQSAVK
jgi:hypothetical protein